MGSDRIRAAEATQVLLPASFEPPPGVDLHARYHSVRCGGDYFDASVVGSRTAFLLTDIAGRRAAAHRIAAVVQEVFRNHAHDLFRAPDANESQAITTLVQEVNSTLMALGGELHSSPTFVGCYNAPLGILTFISAGCHPPLFRDSVGTRTLEGGGVPLGLFTHLTHEPAVQVFEPGAKMLLVTKGVVESGRGRTEFGMDRIKCLLENSNLPSAADICQMVLDSSHEFRTRGSSAVRAVLRLGKSANHDDLTAVALVRPTV
ncbi:MAG TPA: PP2C family protein-serine/threonine phosphatase [Acidobacteriaceae bacterium]|jgi:serine phosphatase RsbU (regulator of sigma subunit)